jgi:integrase
LIERVIEPALEAKGIAFKTLYAGRRGFATILRELTGASAAGRDALGHVSTATTEAHYEKAVPEAVLKGMRLLEEKTKTRSV